MLGENEIKVVNEVFKGLKNPIKLINFTQELECQFCRETREILTELVGLSDKLSLEVYNFQLDKQKVEQYQIDKIPATVIEGEKDYGIRFYGGPFGYEFATLLMDVVEVSKGETDLKPETKAALKKIDHKVHLQVFATPT